MSKHNNRRNSNSNLGEITLLHKTIHFHEKAYFDDTLNINFIEDNEISHHEVTIEAPEKVMRFIQVNAKGIFIKNKQYRNKNIYATVRGLMK